jgi:hypothetical protein
MFYYHVDWQQLPSLPEDAAYFHGYYRQERLSVKGTGHYVGTVLIIQAGLGWFREGDDLFFVDGTGIEDYLS